MERPVDYIERLKLVAVECHGCRHRMQPSPQLADLVIEDEAELHSVAAAMHKSSITICTDPKFTLEYRSFLVDARLIPAPQLAPPAAIL